MQQRPHILLADPSFYRIETPLNPLTRPTSRVTPARVHNQHQRLRERLEDAGARVTVVGPPNLHLPDQVFLSNAALVVGSLVILSRFAVRPRRGEEDMAADWFAVHRPDLDIVRLPAEEGLYFEGQGSCRWSHDGTHLWIGYGAGRTTRRGAEAVRSIVTAVAPEITVHLLQIRDERTYHLDLCFCPLPNGQVLWHAGSFTPASRSEVERIFGRRALIDVPLRFIYGCNAMPVGRDTLIVSQIGDPEWRAWLRARVVMRHIVFVNVSEFELAGGSVYCLCLLA